MTPTRDLSATRALLAAAGVTGAAVAAHVAYRHPDNRLDRAMHRAIRRARTPGVQRVVRALSPAGKPQGFGPAAVLLAFWVARRTGRWRAGAPIVASAVAATAAKAAFDRWIPVRPPPPEKHEPHDPSFPSGHGLATATVAAASALTLRRHRLGTRGVLLPAAIAYPLLSGVAKLYTGRHWTIDVIGGWSVGAALGAAIGGR